MDSKKKSTRLDDKTKRSNTPKPEINPKDLERFSKELTKKINEISVTGGNKSSRRFGFKINPIILVVTVIMAGFLIVSLFNREVFMNKTSLDTLVKGIESNEYSQIKIQDNGKIITEGKYYVIVDSEVETIIDQVPNVKVSLNESDLEIMSVENLAKLVKPVGLINKFKAFLNSGNSNIKSLIVGEDYIIGQRSEDYKDILIKDINFDTFKDQLEDQNLSIDKLNLPIRNLSIYSKEISEAAFSERLSKDQFESIYNIDGQLIAQKREDFVEKSYIDWTPSIYSFTDILQQEGISLSESNVEIISINVPAGITLDDILTILMLVGFVILGIVIFRGAQASGMGLMQFGQSKAKMFFGQKTDTNFDDVAGIDEAREELNEIVAFLRTPNKFRKLGARIPKGILMFGAPGTGKTLLARAIAGEAGVPFFHTSGSEFEEMLVGAGASRVRDLFAKAKKAAPSLIFIDEIDAVARKRGTRIQSGNTEQTLNQILVEMDGFEKNTNVIVIAATNRPDVLDPAILRPGRFDRQVRIELPDVTGREQILKIHGKNKPFDETVDLGIVAKRTVGFTGADLENILNEAAIIAAKENKSKIAMDDIDEAVSKVILGPAKKSRKRTDEELKLVAYHEAGHALVAKYTLNSTPVDKISIVSRGGTGGVTMFLPEKDENIISKGKLLADIRVSLGGRAAEEVVLDDISTGASGDIKKATEIARRMIQQYGMSEKLGMIEYGDHEESGLGYGYGDSKEYSEKTAELIDEEVRQIVSDAYIHAVDVVKKNRKNLDKLANLLLEKEVVGKEDYEKIFE